MSYPPCYAKSKKLKNMKTKPCSITRFKRHIITPFPARPCRFAHRQITLCRLRLAASFYQFAIIYQLFAICYLRFLSRRRSAIGDWRLAIPPRPLTRRAMHSLATVSHR